MRKILFCALSFVFTKPLLAQDTTSSKVDLDPITVTASYNPLQSSQTGRNLIVINSERFAQLPVHTIDELLRYVPGLELQSRGPLGSQSDITLRGGTFQQVLVIIDGMRVNDPNTGHFTSYIPIAANEIERIEILKGASSAIYGSDAVGGVINIITKTFAAKKDVQKESQFTRLTLGEYQTLMADVGINKSNGKTSFGFGGQYIETKGQRQRGTRGTVESENITASFGHYFGNNWQLALRGSYDKREFAAQNFYTSSVADTAQETVTSFWNQLQLTKTGNHNTLRLQVGFKSLKDSFAFNKITATNQNRSQLWQALLTHEAVSANAKTTVTSGLQFVNKKIVSNDRGNHSIYQAAGFVVLNNQLSSSIFLSTSLRLESNQRAGWEAIPQVAFSYRKKKFQLRSSVGKTIRDADFTERFNNYNKTIVTTGQRLGNPDLQAEHSFSYEGGGDYYISNVKFSGTFFQRYHKKLIDYVLTPFAEIPRKENLIANGTYAYAQNIASVTTTGVEADLQVSKKFATGNKLWATLGTVWLNSNSSNAVPSFYISSHAKFMANMAIQYTHKRFAASFTGIYKKRQPQTVTSPLIAPVSSDYFIMNAKAEVFVWKDVSVFAETTNITDRTYTDLLGAQMPGRWFMAGFKISFEK